MVVAGTGGSTVSELGGATVRAAAAARLGAELVGSTRPWNALVRGYAMDQSRGGSATVVGDGRGATSEWAAFANATAYAFTGPNNSVTFATGAANVSAITVTVTIGYAGAAAETGSGSCEDGERGFGEEYRGLHPQACLVRNAKYVE